MLPRKSCRHVKCTAGQRRELRLGPRSLTSCAGGLIRTWGVSLLAAAAIAATLLLARRTEPRPAHALVPAGETQPAEQSLDAIRAAGL